MGKLTLEEKRLQQIRQQLFGKERPSAKVTKQSAINTKEVTTPAYTSSATPANLGEARYLRQDISKVLVLSLLAVGSQLGFYYLSTQGIISLNMFHLF